MSKLLQLRGGTTSQHNSFTGAVREVTVDTDKDTLVVHDGSTQGGFALPRTSTEIAALIANDAITGAKIQDNVALAGSPTTTTQSASDNSTKIATTAYTDAAIAALADSAPSTLNTLNELAAALGDDANYSTTTTNAIAAKLPLAGGTMTGDITLGDNVKAKFGAGDDLQIYHDGDNSYIRDAGTGDLTIQAGNDLRLQDPTTKAYLTCNQDDSVQIYYDNNVRFQTTNAGVSVTGSITPSGSITHTSDLNLDAASDIVLDADGGKIKFRDGGTDIAYLENSNSGDLLIKSITDNKDIKIQGKDGGSFITACTFDMSSAGAATFNSYVDLGTNNIYTGDNGKAVFGAGEDLQIFHSSSDNNSYIDENGAGSLYVRANDLILGKYTGETYIDCNQDGSVDLYHDNSKKLETTAGGIAVTGNIYGTSNIGLDGTDAISFSNGSHINFTVNGGEEMRLEADGDLHVDGDVIAYSTTISDERLKDNIEVVEGALDKVKELKGVTFTRKQDGQESAGVIAQDVEKVLPQAVKHKALPLQTGDDELFKTVQYDALHALLIESIKELSARVEKLEAK